MQPFNIKSTWVYPNVEHWTNEILKSLEHLNQLYHNETGTILDVGGGSAPISQLVNSQHYSYILVDPKISRLKLAPNFVDKREGYGESIPVDDNSIDIILTSSCLQYMDQPKFFDECKRVLKTGGLIAVHENGPKNPIILFARLTQRTIGLFNKKHWVYRNSIKKYYSPKEIDGLEIVYKSHSGLLTPLMLYAQLLKIKVPNKLYLPLLKTDTYLLEKFKFLKKFSFLNIVIYIKT